MVGLLSWLPYDLEVLAFPFGFPICQGSLHYTPEHCLVNGAFPVFWWKKPWFQMGNMYLLKSPTPPKKNILNGAPCFHRLRCARGAEGIGPSRQPRQGPRGWLDPQQAAAEPRRARGGEELHLDPTSVVDRWPPAKVAFTTPNPHPGKGSWSPKVASEVFFH